MLGAPRPIGGIPGLMGGSAPGGTPIGGGRPIGLIGRGPPGPIGGGPLGPKGGRILGPISGGLMRGPIGGGPLGLIDGGNLGPIPGGGGVDVSTPMKWGPSPRPLPRPCHSELGGESDPLSFSVKSSSNLPIGMALLANLVGTSLVNSSSVSGSLGVLSFASLLSVGLISMSSLTLSPISEGTFESFGPSSEASFG